MSTNFNTVLVSLAFNQAVNFIAHGGIYSITRAQIKFLILCACFDRIERKHLMQHLPDGNLYRYLVTLRRGGMLYCPKWGHYAFTDQGRRLVAEFWDEYHKRVKNFRW